MLGLGWPASHRLAAAENLLYLVARMYRQPHQQPPGALRTPICGDCGVIAPTQTQACALCGKAFGHQRVFSPAGDELLWVAVRCSFQCRGCHFLSPLDELDIDGSVECAQCAMHQRFDVGAWQEALAFAHGVADLAFPPPEGRHPNPYVWVGGDNPHIRIGYTEVFGEHRQSSTTMHHGMTVHRSLFIQVSPGYPVCAKCGGALRVALKGDRTNARCDECGEQASYRLPPGANQYAAELVGVVAVDHRMDKPLAVIDTHGGTHTLKCGQCGGDLPVTKDRVVECRYCNATNLVPTRARARDPGAQIVPEIWWLAFRGPSAQRAIVEAPPILTTGLTKYVGGETHLEHAQKKKGMNIKQLMISLLLPSIALVAGYFIFQMLGLHKLSLF